MPNNSLLRAAALVRKGWTQEAFARDSAGNQVPPDNENACKWCAVGAIEAANMNPGNVEKALKLFRSHLPAEHNSAVEFNDAPERTAEQVADLMEKAAYAE